MLKKRPACQKEAKQSFHGLQEHSIAPKSFRIHCHSLGNLLARQRFYRLEQSEFASARSESTAIYSGDRAEVKREG